jgi:hypothetical protein
MNKEFAKLCTPAKLYFTLAVLSIIMGLFTRINILAIIMKLVFAGIWTFFLAWICDRVNPMISWFLVLAPFIMIVLVGLGIMREIKIIRSLNPMSPEERAAEAMTSNTTPTISETFRIKRRRGKTY